MAELNFKQITDKLNAEFTGDVRKLIFWYDTDAEFAEEIDSLQLENAKVYHLERDNQFQTKLFLEREDTTNNYLMESTQKESSLTPAQLYDMEFWTSVNQLKRYVPALVNEAFGENYTDKAIVTLKPGKQVTERPGERMIRREGDAFINMVEDGRETDYHFECEAMGKDTIALRIVEYASGYAAHSASMIEDGAVIKIPHSAVIYLQSGSAKKTELTMWIEYPGGKVSYYVPIIRMKSYTAKKLFDKDLMILVPFAAFLISEREYALMEKHGTEKLEMLIDDFSRRLNEKVEAKELEPWERGNLLRHMRDVFSKRTAKYEKVKEEAEKIMGGRLIKTDIDIAMEETRALTEEETLNKERIKNIQLVMKKNKYSAEKAMEWLEIPQAEHQKYARLLEQSDVEYDPQK